jgi:hypothetical protein
MRARAASAKPTAPLALRVMTNKASIPWDKDCRIDIVDADGAIFRRAGCHPRGHPAWAREVCRETIAALACINCKATMRQTGFTSAGTCARVHDSC